MKLTRICLFTLLTAAQTTIGQRCAEKAHHLTQPQ